MPGDLIITQPGTVHEVIATVSVTFLLEKILIESHFRRKLQQ